MIRSGYKLLLICTAILAVNLQSFSATTAQNLALIENKIFGYENAKISELERLKKIETFVYGSNKNSDIKSRLKALNTDLGLEPDAKPKTAQKINGYNEPTAEDYANEPTDPTAQYPIVDNIENSILHQTYKAENIYKRLERLEKKAYGKVSKGSLSERVEKLSQLAEPVAPKRTSDFDDYMAENSDYNYFSPSTTNYSHPAESFSTTLPRLDTKALHPSIFSLEKTMLGKTYPEESTEKRLARLEKKLLNKEFPTDTNSSRIERLTTVSNAQQSAKVYKENKLMQNLVTGVQIGGMILMILAMIL